MHGPTHPPLPFDNESRWTPPLLPDATEAELHQCHDRLSSTQEECVLLASELQRLKYQTENYATVFAETDGLTHRLTMAEVRLYDRLTHRSTMTEVGLYSMALTGTLPS